MTEDVIAAFADGEPVDPDQLRAALAEKGGRDYLIDVLVLRGLVSGQPAGSPIHPFTQSPVSPSIPFTYTHSRTRPFTRWRWWASAAAIAGVGVIGGFLAGQWATMPLGREAAAPQEIAAPAVVSSVTAPPPTRVIRLEPGVDWTEQRGGR